MTAISETMVANLSAPGSTAPSERRDAEMLRSELAKLERLLMVNAEEQNRTADRLEVELRVASEMPHLDTAAFAAAQRQRLGSLDHQRSELEARVDGLRGKLLDSFTAR